MQTGEMSRARSQTSRGAAEPSRLCSAAWRSSMSTGGLHAVRSALNVLHANHRCAWYYAMLHCAACLLSSALSNRQALTQLHAKWMHAKCRHSAYSIYRRIKP